MGYTVTVTLDAATVAHLNDIQNGGANPWTLVGCKSVGGSTGGTPVVWFTKNGNFMDQVVLGWEENDYAYISDSQLIAGGQIVATDTPVPIAPNQTATYDGAALSVTDSGNSGAAAQNIVILNNSSNPLCCGLAQQQPTGSDGTSLVPTCAFPIDGNGDVNLLPRVTILLMFTSGQVNTSAVAEKAYGKAVLITLTGHDNDPTTFVLAYDKDKSWQVGDVTWAQIYPQQAELAPILNPDAPAVASVRRLRTAALAG